MNDLITIVVPVYNVEKYLPHTLESICGQTYTNLQILLIDDGSTDDSLAVCHKWARQDNRIQVYEQENQGVARTRNKGIQLATGKYVMFLDADDWVEADMLESLYRLAEADHADVACCLLPGKKISWKRRITALQLNVQLFMEKTKQRVVLHCLLCGDRCVSYIAKI